MTGQNLDPSSRDYWEFHINKWKESDMSQAAYCRQNGLKWHDFYYWKNKVRRAVSSYTRMEDMMEISQMTFGNQRH
jgi:hypothetical protein